LYHFQKRRDRSKSPRPKTLPGLGKDGKPQDVFYTKAPGLVERALADSPHAPQQVKAFAKNLVDGVFSDTIPKQVTEMRHRKRKLLLWALPVIHEQRFPKNGKMRFSQIPFLKMHFLLNKYWATILT